MEEYIGTIVQFGFGFVPSNWQVCHGQLIAIQANQALFALLGTTFGGNGVNNFALPDLRKKDAAGNYYRQGDIMADGLPYIESYICVEGIFPPRQ